MKQILQDLETGKTIVIDTPRPNYSSHKLIIETTISLVSAGTERMLVDFAKASFFDKARQQPDKVRQVLDKIKTDGIATTFEAVSSKLKQPLPLGYCNVGRIAEIGPNVNEFKVGSRVVSNGAHAEVVNASANLCAIIPDEVADETAVFTVLASIGLQGIRLASPTIGESVAVIGAGLIGLLTIQILKANGCRVIAIDFNESRLALAREYGAVTCNPGNGEDPVSAALGFSHGRGIDAVLITASAKTSDPVMQAARMSRKRGRIVLVGVTGLELNRSDFYEKELTFQVSCSYGPGRYDSEYEENGNDYPLGFVRWTEQRNFEAVLDLMSRGLICTSKLITNRFLIDQAQEAYDCLTGDSKALGIILEYPSNHQQRVSKTIKLSERVNIATKGVRVSFIGAGNYAARMLIPAFKKTGVSLISIASASGLTGIIQGEKIGFQRVSTDVPCVIKESDSNVIVIATRHDSHAVLTLKALSAGKHVFVEKPLALTEEDLKSIELKYNSQTKPLLMVGFNRRFAPLVVKMKALLDTIHEPKSFIMTMNAGAIPKNHWTQDSEIGGGRIIGEACHFIDLMRFLADSPIESIQARRLGDNPYTDVLGDKASIILGFKNGSFGTINYFANGAPSFPKERIEAFVGGKVLQIDNFRKLTGFGWKKFKILRTWKQDKGQTACVEAFISAIRNGNLSPIPADELFEVARAAISIENIIRKQ